MGVPIRSVMWIMLFSCTFVTYMLRINMSIIILGMVQNSNSSSNNIPECSANKTMILTNTTQISENPIVLARNNSNEQEFNWDNKLQGLILGSYFWGSTISSMPGGLLAEKFGPTRVVSFSFIGAGLLTIVGPFAAAWHPIALIATRFFVGLFGGVVYPCLHCLVARWAPPEEKGRFIGALLGGSLGTVCTWPLLGAIIDFLGWSYAFYVCGGIILLWCLAWLYLAADSPAKHRLISEEEKCFIEDSLKGNLTTIKKLPPYKDIILSVPFWALVILHFGNLWGLFFLMTAGPNFMSTVLGFNLGHTGVIASLPYLARLISGFIFGAIGDSIRKRKLLTATQTRKGFVLFSHILPGAFLIGQTFAGCNINASIILITISLGLNGASTLTNLQNSQDLAPNYAGTMYGMANCVGSTSGFITPIIVGYLTASRNGLEEWKIIFYIGASVYIGSGIIFFLLGSAELQSWNDKGTTKEPTLENHGVENQGFEEAEKKLQNTKF